MRADLRTFYGGFWHAQTVNPRQPPSVAVDAIPSEHPVRHKVQWMRRRRGLPWRRQSRCFDACDREDRDDRAEGVAVSRPRFARTHRIMTHSSTRIARQHSGGRTFSQGSLLAAWLSLAVSAGGFGGTRLTAQDATPERKPGHSSHGEAFDEGPRQQARLMEGTGKVSLSITTKAPEGQAWFDQGLGQIHGFWWFEAERSFRQLAMLDHDCAMAYWGMALANGGNEKRAKSFIAEAHKRKDKASAREQRYIQALARIPSLRPQEKKAKAEQYVKALEQILYDFPDELEAKSLLVVALWEARDDGIPISSHLAIDALMSEIFAVAPMHPSHHYRVHLWDHERGAKGAEVGGCVRAGGARHRSHVAYERSHFFGPGAL